MTEISEYHTNHQGTAPARFAHPPKQTPPPPDRRRALPLFVWRLLGSVERFRANRDEFRDLMAISPAMLRDIGLDRPRAIAYPNLR